jgi:8-oxo-(d)GTP phosphatase
MTEPVRAAGGVLWRPAADGIEVCVVHRPQRRDWSVPKGKLEGDEHPLVAAVREVREETGVRGRPQLRLPDVSYVLPDGVPKTVDFWLMRAADGPAAAIADAGEVDELAWLTPSAAAARLDYPDDVRLVEHVAALPPVTAVTALVRHAHAGQRKAWSGEDGLRPIDPLGQTQSEGLAEVLAPVEPGRLFTAPPLRCKQTLEPLADRLGLPIVMDSAFAEPGDPDELPAKVKAAAARLLELRSGPTAVICSQGKLMPPLLAHLRNAADPEEWRTPKGGGWLLTWSDDRLLGLSPL